MHLAFLRGEGKAVLTGSMPWAVAFGLAAMLVFGGCGEAGAQPTSSRRETGATVALCTQLGS